MNDPSGCHEFCMAAVCVGKLEPSGIHPRLGDTVEQEINQKVPLAPAECPKAANGFGSGRTLVNGICIIEAYSLGDGSRALARAQVLETMSGKLLIIPIYCRELQGRCILWEAPMPGLPIPTDFHILRIERAREVLAGWATAQVNRRLQT
jgi:hypothetical protein